MLNSTSSSSSAEDLANRNEVTAVLLEELEEIIEDIDFAQIFVNFGGTKCLLQTAKETESSGISESNRANCLGIIGTLAQNNITVQDILLKDGVIPVLMNFRESASGVSSSSASSVSSSGNGSDKVWSKALYALGGIVKNHPVAEVMFLQHYAANAFSNLDNNHISNAVKRRCVYLALFLVGQDVTRVSSLIQYFIPALFEFVKDPNDPDLREGSLQLLANLARTESGKKMIGENIDRVIEERNKTLVADEDYDDTREKELIDNLRVTLRAEPEPDTPTASATSTAPTPGVLMLEPPQLTAASKAP